MLSASFSIILVLLLAAFNQLTRQFFVDLYNHLAVRSKSAKTWKDLLPRTSFKPILERRERKEERDIELRSFGKRRGSGRPWRRSDGYGTGTGEEDMELGASEA